MKNKNKNKNIEFIYFKKFNSGDFSHVKSEKLSEKEKKEGKKVDVIDKKQLTSNTNSSLSKFQSRLKALPSDLQTAVRTHVNQYFYNSYSQYDDNSKKGLNKEEFHLYRRAIVNKLNSILDKYTPSKRLLSLNKTLKKKQSK